MWGEGHGFGWRSVSEFEQHIGVAWLIGAAKAGKIFAAQLVDIRRWRFIGPSGR